MFKNILIPLDGSSLAEYALPHAVALATTFGSRLSLVRVLTQPDDENGNTSRPIDRVDWAMRRQAAESYLAEVAEQLQALGLAVNVAMLEGSAAQQIVEYSCSTDVDFIVLSSHGRSGLSQWNVSNVTQKTLNLANLSALIVRSYAGKPAAVGELRYRRILVPVDGSARAEFALSPAALLAQQHHAQLVLAHAIVLPAIPHQAPLTQEDHDLIHALVTRNEQAANEYLNELATRVSAVTGIRLMVSDDAATSLHELVDQEDMDLVVMSAHGRSGKNRWPYGSVTTSFIQYGGTALLIVQDFGRNEIARSKAALAIEHARGH